MLGPIIVQGGLVHYFVGFPREPLCVGTVGRMLVVYLYYKERLGSAAGANVAGLKAGITIGVSVQLKIFRRRKEERS